ncbi:MAG: hypothetical protein ACPGXY_03455 [Alphaproteobacteria bacterium]
MLGLTLLTLATLLLQPLSASYLSDVEIPPIVGKKQSVNIYFQKEKPDRKTNFGMGIYGKAGYASSPGEGYFLVEGYDTMHSYVKDTHPEILYDIFPFVIPSGTSHADDIHISTLIVPKKREKYGQWEDPIIIVMNSNLTMKDYHKLTQHRGKKMSKAFDWVFERMLLRVPEDEDRKFQGLKKLLEKALLAHINGVKDYFIACQKGKKKKTPPIDSFIMAMQLMQKINDQWSVKSKPGIRRMYTPRTVLINNEEGKEEILTEVAYESPRVAEKAKPKRRKKAAELRASTESISGSVQLPKLNLVGISGLKLEKSPRPNKEVIVRKKTLKRLSRKPSRAPPTPKGEKEL